MLQRGGFALRYVHAQRRGEPELAPEIIRDPWGDILDGREEAPVDAHRAELDRQREPEMSTILADLGPVIVGQRPILGQVFLRNIGWERDGLIALASG